METGKWEDPLRYPNPRLKLTRQRKDASYIQRRVHVLSFKTYTRMRITRDNLFQILNLQTLTIDGNLVTLLTQRGEPDYVIEVIGELFG